MLDGRFCKAFKKDDCLRKFRDFYHYNSYKNKLDKFDKTYIIYSPRTYWLRKEQKNYSVQIIVLYYNLSDINF